MQQSGELKANITASQVNFRAIFDYSSEFLALMQLDGTLIEVNKTGLDLGGVTQSEVINRPFWLGRWWTISSQTQARLQSAIAIAATGKVIRYQVDILSIGDRIATIDFSIKPIKDENGQVIWLMSEGQDIQHHYQTEQALRESEERFRATFEQAAVGIAHIAIDGKWLRVNQKLCEIVGYTTEELLQMTFQEITHPDDLEADLNSIHKVLASQIENCSMEKRYIRKDNSIVWIDLTYSLAKEGERKGFSSSSADSSLPHCAIASGYFIAVIEEISDRKLAELALKQRAEELTNLTTILSQTTALLQKRNQELDQFAYVASHDLKAPLRAIANLSEWIEEDINDLLPEENRHQMHLLRGRVQRMEGLINGLLEYSRVGRVQPESSSVDVGLLLQEVIDSLAPPSTFTIEIASRMPVIMTKRLPLQQVFANLISNAILHHPRTDGYIKISFQERKKYYEFAVSDDGSGIAPEYHQKVFAIFQTLEARDQKESTGIGLAIVKKIVEAQGGTITVKSQLNAGSTFRFTWYK